MNIYSNRRFGRSIVQYTTGRALNALAAFVVFLLIARSLPEAQYANYIAAYACLELAWVVFGFGMEWVTAVYVPQVSLKAGGRRLCRFVWSCAAIQTVQLLLGCLVLFSLAPFLTTWLHLEDATGVFRLYALVMFTEGLSRVFRDQLLSCLLLQGAAQLSQMARNVAMLAFAMLLAEHLEWRNASAVAVAEMAASSVSLGLAAFLLWRYLRELPRLADSVAAWPIPPWREMLRAGHNAWLSNLANLSWGGQAVILLVTRLIGAEATAALGFSRNLAEQVRRYMPMEFLLGIIRAMLIARFVEDGDTRRLGIRAGLMYRANLLFLLPLLVLAAVRGDELCALLSGGRYASAHWLLVGWLAVLVFWAHHRLSDLLAHALERSNLTSRSSLRLLATPVLLAAAAYFRSWALLFPILATAELVYSFAVLKPLGIYRPNWRALAKLFVASVPVAILLASPIWRQGAFTLAIQAALSFVVIGGGAIVLRAWSDEELRVVFPQKALAVTH